MTKTHLFSFALCAFLIAGFCASAKAQTSRLYLAGYLGLNVSTNRGFAESSSSATGDLELDDSTSFAGALGMRLSHQLRVEGEFSYRSADFSSTDISGIGTFAAGGELESSMLMANVYYDFEMPSWPVEPYVGGGIGYAWHTGNISDASGVLPNVSSDDTSFVWNAAAGVKYRTRDDLAFSAGYRYLDTISDLQFGSYDLDYASHEFRLGMEWDLPIR